MKVHTSKIEVRFFDIDVMGHVNNAVYLNYFEQARMHFFRAIVGKDWDWVNAGVLLARNEIDYIEPVYLFDDLHIETHCSKIGNKSLDINYTVFVPDANNKKIKATGKSILVCFDYTQKITIPVPQLWRELLQ